MACLMLGPFAVGNGIRLATDPVIVGYGTPVSIILQGIRFPWSSSVLLGDPYSSGLPTVASFLNLFLPTTIANNWIYVLGCIFASNVFLFHLHKSRAFPAIAMGILTAFWTGSNLTLSYPGHDFKSYVVLFFVATIFAAHSATGCLGGIIWGGFAGLMFVQQPDIALFFVMVAGSHLLFTLWRHFGMNPMPYLKVLLPAAITMLLLAAPPLLNGYRLNVKDTAQVQTDNPEQKWNYVTQWSFPPDEMIDLIAPNYTGIRSGEPEGPYWGRTGRSAEWDHTGQGFMNYRMESVYVGFIPVVFAVFALWRRRQTKHYPTVLFWTGATILSLMLSFGRYFPLYRLFYMLPVVNGIRNPNKFLQVFQVCLAMLSMYGVQSMFYDQGAHAEGAEAQASDRVGKKKQGHGKGRLPLQSAVIVPVGPSTYGFLIALFAATGILLLGALAASGSAEGIARRFASRGWSPTDASVIAANQSRALWHAFLMALAATAACIPFCVARFSGLRKFRTWIASGLVLVVSADCYILSRHYIKELPRRFIEANPLTEFLTEHLGTERVSVVTQQGIYSAWQNYLLPFHRIPTFSFAQMPRMSIDYQHLLQAGAQNPLRLWRFASVKYLLGPAVLSRQLPPDSADMVFRYDVIADGDGSFIVREAHEGSHAVFELKDYYPRYLLLTGIHDEPLSGALDRLARQDGPILSGIPIRGAVSVLRYSPAMIDLKIESEKGGLLRIAERWDPDWKVWLNGKEVPVLRIESLLQGVDIPAGKHEVRIAYRPPQIFFYAQLAGLLSLIAAGGWLVISRRQANSQMDSEPSATTLA